MSTYSHYQQHLGPIYAWMAGDFETATDQFQSFLVSQGLETKKPAQALDLGAGHGIQSVALARTGYTVTAVDFNQQLLDALEANKKSLPIHTLLGDITKITPTLTSAFKLIVCVGDTLTHLDSVHAVEQLLIHCHEVLAPGGHIVISLRDYCTAAPDGIVTIPVREDEYRSLTCVLDYQSAKVKVTDIIKEYNAGAWATYSSSYYKLRLAPQSVKEMLMACGLTVQMLPPSRGMYTLVGTK